MGKLPPRKEMLDAMKTALTPEGFKQQKNTFYRTNRSGFVDVVNLQAGTGPLAAKETVNLGVFIPDVARLLTPGLPKSIPKEYECHVRMRLSRLAFGDDHWFDRKLPKTASQVSALTKQCALPFFREFDSLDAIAIEAEAGKFPKNVVSPALQATVLVLLGRKEDARLVLVSNRSDNPRRIDRVAEALNLSLE